MITNSQVPTYSTKTGILPVLELIE